MFRLLLLFISCALLSVAHGQRAPKKLVIEGIVLGYTNDHTKTLFKKGKQIELQGSIPDVIIAISTTTHVFVYSDKTDKGGAFRLSLDLGREYYFEYNKKGYGTSTFKIDLRNIPDDLYQAGLILGNIELILNNYISDHPFDNGESFGKLYFDEYSRQFEFSVAEYSAKRKLFQDEEENTPANLMLRSLVKNISVNKTVEPPEDVEEQVEDKPRRRSNRKPKVEVDTVTILVADSTVVKPIPKEIIDLVDINYSDENLSDNEIEEFSSKIELERSRLAFDKLHATTDAEKQNIFLREKLLIRAERDLMNARIFIAAQADRLSAQQNFMYAAYTLILMLLVIGFLIWRAYRSKKKSTIVFRAKNKKINDSIDYALRIQRSVLLSPDEIAKIVPKFFVYYRPLENVSGDFYWFSKIKNKIVIAAVDCTGHGVPGAFMSLIGNTLLNHIVNEKQITSPAVILNELHKGVVSSLNQEVGLENAQDGMDIALCCIDEDTLEMKFSGAMNPVYIMQNDEIVSLSGEVQTIGGLVRRKKNPDFKEQHIQLKPGNRIYLFSDGYMDQFGGENDKKFNVSRFKNMIMELKDFPMDHQVDKVDKTFDDWKGDTDQIDDVLVIGVEV